ncbi:MAG TPA: tetratricopeptide repeat protein [Gemmatimonadaceae bacterium]|jgi:predicted ATPase/class 3 adenylate cyclase
MSALPTGTVTFLFTDIEGSTRLWQQHPEPMKQALLRHHALLQQSIESSNGYVFQIVGDAFCAAFHTAAGGVAAALAAQRALAAEPWGETGPIRVRMALHTGTADLHAGEHKAGEYMSGLTLSHTARLLSVAHGGQILVSNATQELVRNDLPSLVELRNLGLHRLRDLTRAEHVYQVVAQRLPDRFPALRSLEVVPNNLPRQLTTFIGREREIAEAKRLLAETHLLTITGPGGSGKTRLSLEIGARLLSEYPDGVWLVEFAHLADPARVPQVLATALSVREEADRPLLVTLVDHLRPKRVLLLLDNCEHLIDACAGLADTLLRGCPEVKILPSSREALGLTGEVVFRVPPLSLPDSRLVPALERLAEYEAVRLFVDRAIAVKPDFTLTDDTAAAVVQICRRLDGIPLAIELAAARVRTLSVQQITAHLDERFRLLTGGSRTALPRHQTLRGLIDWSYGLLSEAERELFRRVSVFVGGWTLEASVAVCAGVDVDRYDIVELLGRLVDKSLCLIDGEGSDPRYRLLETIRQYGFEKLAETSEGQVVRARHRDFYLGFAEDAEPRLQGPEQVAWLQRLEADHDNLRAALRWSLDCDETEAALRLGSALSLFWDTHGYVREGREWLDELLAHARERPTSTVTTRRALGKVLDAASRTRARWSEFPQATEFLTQGLAVWRELGDKRGIAEALNNLAVGATQSGDRVRARVLVAESLALFRELSDKRGTAHALNNLAEILRGDGDLPGARALFEESVPLFEAIEERRGLSHALDNLGGILTAQGDYGPAEALYSRSRRLAEELGDNHAVATALRSLGGVAHHRGDHERARSFYEDSVARFREMGDGFCLAKSLIGYALTSHEMGDHEQARVLGDQGLALLREAGAKGELAPRLGQLGAAALAHGDVARAARFFEQSLALYSETHDEQGIATSREGLARVARQ